MPRNLFLLNRGNSGFNPHPARGPGDARLVALLTASLRGFNPHPARGPGDADNLARAELYCGCFNPHPARGPGDALVGGLDQAIADVSIRTRPEGRVMREQTVTELEKQLVSIRTRPEGRVMRF